MSLFSCAYNGLRSISNVFGKNMQPFNCQLQQVRTKYANNWQLNDQRRRACVRKHSLERSRALAIYRCNLLPPELRDIAHQDVDALPRNSNYIRLRNRCYVTSRPRALVQDFRVSRIVFRHLADYNKLCGVQRALW